MPRYNVQNPMTKEWRCFSSIVDDWITDWMDEEQYQKWRKFVYGENAKDLHLANIMDLSEAEEIIQCRKRWEDGDAE